MSNRRAQFMEVKDKTASKLQITAEQLLREAWERQEPEPERPKQTIADEDELKEYGISKRREFEDKLRLNQFGMATWIKYAVWEAEQGMFDRSRSVFERALKIEYQHIPLWLRYAEMEMKNKKVNHARNVWDRAITYLPRVNQFWLKYILMEDTLGNYAGVRKIYERWMEWEPDKFAWHAYIKFEQRNGELSRVRGIYERYVLCHQSVYAFLRWAKWEEKQGNLANAREAFESAQKYLDEEANDPDLFIAFAEFEERCREYDRARAIYKYALDHVPKEDAEKLFKKFVKFEKQYGSREGIEEVIMGKRRFQYEHELAENPKNYDVWFDYARLEEASSDHDTVREVYERAIANVPPGREKRHWRRYIFLWINYALFEELEAKETERARAVYRACINLIPHKQFSFSKIWVLFANFEVRQRDLTAARSILGHAIGMAPSQKIFQTYVELELQLGNVERSRTIYEKYIEWMPENCKAWSAFAKLEIELGEMERARAIYRLAIEQPALDMPELVWRNSIDFEISQGENESARRLYRALLDRTKHVRVWLSFAKFELAIGNNEASRSVYKEAFKQLKDVPDQEERVLLWDNWREFEHDYGDEETKKEVEDMHPKRIIKKRPVFTEDGEPAGEEEYPDYVFPDQVKAKPTLKILEMAKKWKQKQNAEKPVDAMEE